MPFCCRCGACVQNQDVFCPACGTRQFQAPTSVWNLDKIGANPELNQYLLNAQGIGRKALNIMCFIGFFTVGYLLIAIFDMLGRPRMGWVYFLTFGSIVLLTFESGVPVLLVWPVVYVVGWLHANVILSRIESLARRRVAEIDQQAADPYALVEKAMLQVKVLRQREQAICTAEKALLMRGNDPMLLYTMGVALFANKRYAEAKPLLDRALAEVKDETAARLIRRDQALVNKKLRRLR